MGCLDRRTFLTGKFAVPKVSVLPVSNTICGDLLLSVGGPESVARVTCSLAGLADAVLDTLAH